MRPIAAVFAFATFCAAAPNGQPRVEMGEINGAKFRIDIPANWNGGLVMYCHGYSPIAVSYEEGPLPPVLAVFTDQGYALAESGYAAGGWAIQEAVPGYRGSAETLRREVRSAQGELYHRPFHGWIPDHAVHGTLPNQL